MKMKFCMESLQEKNKIILDNRASAILYRFLINKLDKGFLVLPVNICPIVAMTVKATGFLPIYVDVSVENYCLNFTATKELIQGGSNVKGILINHTYGIECDFSDFIINIQKIWDGFIIEDKCLSKPDLSEKCYADLTLFSTGYAKYVELEYGGGIGVSKDSNVLDFPSQYISLSNETGFYLNTFKIPLETYLNDINIKLKKIENNKDLINSIYIDHLENIALDSKFNNWRFNVKIDEKEKLIKKIFSQNLFVSSHYIPISENQNEFPVAWDLYNKIINLFNDKYFDVLKAKKLVEIIKQHVQ